jgi:hypothetical protein
MSTLHKADARMAQNAGGYGSETTNDGSGSCQKKAG